MNSDEVKKQTRARWALRVGIVGLVALIVWAAYADVDQVTRAPAQIITVARTQVVQSPDGGVISEIHVRDGELVKKGQKLVTLERARAKAAMDESRAKVAALRTSVTRLDAEVYGHDLRFDSDLMLYEDYIRNQTSLYRKRKTAIDQDVAALQKMLSLAGKELAMNLSLQETGDVSRAEILRLERNVAEIEAQIANKKNKYFQDAQAELTKAQEDLNSYTEQLRDRTQVLEHTELQAPTDGVVKDIRITTVGGVVRPGEVIIEILPTESDLIAEAKIIPADIAFIQVGQPASVKLDAYDYSIFGSMNGEVAYISADTLTEETRQGPLVYYRVRIRIGEAEFKGSKATHIQVRPGMTANVEIKAMERSVLSYLLKPVAKTLAESLGER
jgi:adhesin transport system membrane fusion protein